MLERSRTSIVYGPAGMSLTGAPFSFVPTVAISVFWASALAGDARAQAWRPR
jgi:hypothetical protein